MVADALDRLGDEHQIDARRDRPRVFHHEGDQLAHQPFELTIDLVVLLQHFERLLDVEAGKRVERLAQQLDRQLGFEREVGHRQAHAARHAAVDEPLHRACDARRFVADALEIGNRFADRDQQAQVACRRLTPRDDRRQIAVDLDLHRVDVLFLRQHLRCRLAAEVGQRVERLRDLRLDQAAHLEHAGRDAAQLGIELSGKMLVAHPNLPVM